jgi:hypothetical protein
MVEATLAGAGGGGAGGGTTGATSGVGWFPLLEYLVQHALLHLFCWRWRRWEVTVLVAVGSYFWWRNLFRCCSWRRRNGWSLQPMLMPHTVGSSIRGGAGSGAVGASGNAGGANTGVVARVARSVLL